MHFREIPRLNFLVTSVLFDVQVPLVDFLQWRGQDLVLLSKLASSLVKTVNRHSRKSPKVLPTRRDERAISSNNVTKTAANYDSEEIRCGFIETNYLYTLTSLRMENTFLFSQVTMSIEATLLCTCRNKFERTKE